MKKIIFFILAGLLLNSVVAFGNDLQIVENTPSEKNIKSSNSFGAQLWLTDDQEYLKKWNQSTEGFFFHPLHSVLRGKPIFVIVLFAGQPGINDKNLCDITIDIIVKSPDGKIYGEQKNGDCWQNLPIPPKQEIQLCNSSMGIVIEEKDQSGRYTVEAIVKDKIKNIELTLEQYFDVK